MENQENGVLEAKYKRRREWGAQQMMLKARKVKTGALTSEVSKCAFTVTSTRRVSVGRADVS